MKINVCVVTFPLGLAGYTPLSNLVRILNGLASRVYLVSGGVALEKLGYSKLNGNVQAVKVVHRVSSNVLMRIINYIHTQLKILCCIFIISSKVDLFIFFIGGEGMILPILVLKLLGKKVILMPGGIATKVYSTAKDPLTRFLSLLFYVNLNFVDRLVLYSSRLIREGGFDKYQGKIVIAHRHFLDFAKFTMKKKVNERSNSVGYIGRLSREKGVLNLVDAIPYVLKKKSDVYFMICGDGSLAYEIKRKIKINNLEMNTKIVKWIPHEKVPQYLNKLKLLILPSFTEGLPNVILEAMACGTPVLATPVGAIPEIIKDGETGFLLESNDPQHIADRIIELLDKPDLLKIVSANAYKYVRERFSYKRTLKIWIRIFKELSMGKQHYNVKCLSG